MPRLTNPLSAVPKFKKFRSYCHRPLPEYRILLPPVLKDHISKGPGGSPPFLCATELIQLFNCFKKNDFNEHACQKVIEKLNRCTEKLKARGHREIKEGKSGKSHRDYSLKNINDMLSKYKQPPPSINLKKS